MKEYTGYPHIDKMWMEKYDTSLIECEVPPKTIYQYMKEKSAPVKEKTAITYFGKEILYDELYENIKLSSKVFTDLGDRKSTRLNSSHRL